MLNVGVLPHHKRWGDFLANLGWVVVDEAHTYRGVFGSHVANVLRRLRRVARLYGEEPRFVLASATIANPGELAERLTGLPFELLDDDGAPRAGREIAMWNPPVIEQRTMTRRSPGLGGGGSAGRAGLARGADDLLHAQPARDRADQQRSPRRSSRSRGQAELAERIAPYRAGYTPQQRREIEARLVCRRAARGRRHRRARARDRHRRARRGDLRHLPRHGRQPAPDVGAGGPPQARARRLRRRPGRARPVLLPPPGRVPRAAGRGGDPRPPLGADPDAAPARGGLRGAARPGRRRDLRARTGESGPSAW